MAGAETLNVPEEVEERAPLLKRTQISQNDTIVSARNIDASDPETLTSKNHGPKSMLLVPFEKIQDVFQKMTWNLFLIWMVTSITNIMFGYASTSFSGLQSIPSFTQEFGTPNGVDGSYSLSASKVSFMSSIGLAGKLFGTLVGPIQIERLGHKATLLMASLISLAGIAIGCTSHTVAQFVASRVIIYYSVGVVEVATPMYQAEIVPASMRGTVVGSIQLFNQIGQILSASINRVYYRSTEPGGWIAPVAAQAVFPLAFLSGLYFLPASPRWLLSKSRKEAAIISLETVRPRADVDAGLCRAEADAIQDALRNNTEKAPWIRLFRGTNFRRTCIVVCVLALQQLTGQAFVSQYSPRFYKIVGLGDKGFNYNIASAFAGWTSCLIGMVFSDVVGRRDLLIWGGVAQVLFLFLVAVFGSVSHPSGAAKQGLVASVVLFVFVFTGTWAPSKFSC